MEAELRRRADLWTQLVSHNQARGLPPKLLHELGAYGGQQGIWVDSETTHSLVENAAGVTVSVLHKGDRYADDLLEDGLLYHYPQTRRGNRDQTEIQATKNAALHRVPIFVITASKESAALRDVRQAWVIDWDDASHLFLVGFQPPVALPIAPAEVDKRPFHLTTTRPDKQLAPRLPRPGQELFKFEVLKRYGALCALCDFDVPELLDGAHLCPVSEGGSDDPRNGLPLCPLHHRAVDCALIRVDPHSLTVSAMSPHSLASLRVKHDSLRHLPKLPHELALQALAKPRKRKR